MNRTIRAIKVLDYYDGVLAFTGEDSNARLVGPPSPHR